ncbi:MAG: methyltransferase domain-containing protein [Bdellovibrionaceae bacterium]|nr:methyltransferase domain-containing protein [Pseudobdellovibrionaceae bacterium]
MPPKGSFVVGTIESVKEYYGKVLQGSKDLKTSACCSVEALSPALQKMVSEVHPEVRERFYGCGAPFPAELKGATVLDLGCGTGRDCYVLSQLVGESGQVIGVDMTHTQLEIARAHEEFHRKKFGYARSNVKFLEGYIEDLQSIGIADASVDVVVSNCVTNLSPDKERVYSELLRVLKPGGELYLSDVFSLQRLPSHFREDPILLGECLGGAMYVEDFRRLLFDLGVRDYRVMNRSKIELVNESVSNKAGGFDFYSITIRAFKLDLEDRCEDYGQTAYYLGTIPQLPHGFRLDDHHYFVTGKRLAVCSNTAAMLHSTRYAPHFRIEGDLSRHYGLFDCGPSPAVSPEEGTGACC